MTSLCATLSSGFLLPIGLDTGSSAEAMTVERVVGQWMQHYAGPKIESMLSEIDRILVESNATAQPLGDSIPVDVETAEAAVLFASLLPWSLPIPEIAPEPDGEISFDWLGASGKMFSVSVNKSGRIAFAGRFGERSKIHGTEQLSQICPPEIIGGIARATL